MQWDHVARNNWVRATYSFIKIRYRVFIHYFIIFHRDDIKISSNPYFVISTVLIMCMRKIFEAPRINIETIRAIGLIGLKIFIEIL